MKYNLDSNIKLAQLRLNKMTLIIDKVAFRTFEGKWCQLDWNYWLEKRKILADIYNIDYRLLKYGGSEDE